MFCVLGYAAKKVHLKPQPVQAARLHLLVDKQIVTLHLPAQGHDGQAPPVRRPHIYVVREGPDQRLLASGRVWA